MISIVIPQNVSVSWGKNFVQVAGPLGILVKKRGSLRLAIKKDRIYVIESDSIKSNFYLSILRSLINGVSIGYRFKLRLVGIGFRAQVEGKKLILKIGFSHDVVYNIPEDIHVTCSKVKGTLLIVSGRELQSVRQAVAKIKSLRYPDVYKGKGIHDEREKFRLKKGKREGK
jgi:large subunit ribosomal protein L6